MNILQIEIIAHQDSSQFKVSTDQLRAYQKLHAADQCIVRKAVRPGSHRAP